MGPRGSHVPVLLLPQGLGITRVFVDEIGALTFATYSEAVWADLGPLPFLGPAGVFGGATFCVSVSL